MHSVILKPNMKSVISKQDENISFYYINTSEIPSELSRENFISSHVKMTCFIIQLHLVEYK